MALSNWDTLALSFSCLERRVPEDDPRVAEAARVTGAVEDQLLEQAKGDVQRLFSDPQLSPAWSEASRAHAEACTLRSLDQYPSNGVFRDEDEDWTVEIYKNWVYLRSESRWSQGSGFVFPTLMEIQSGSLRLGRTHLLAWRGPQEGVVVAAYQSRHGQDDEGPYCRISGMIGTGVYGYGSNETEDVDADEDTWAGVRASTVEWLARQLAEGEQAQELPRAFGCLDWSQAQRFNQGDQLFAAHLGIDTPATAPGQAERNILNEVMDGMLSPLPPSDEAVQES